MFKFNNKNARATFDRVLIRLGIILAVTVLNVNKRLPTTIPRKIYELLCAIFFLLHITLLHYVLLFYITHCCCSEIQYQKPQVLHGSILKMTPIGLL